MLARTVPLADGLAALFYPFVEVVVHDLATQTIVHLANNLSRRAVGDATALDDIEFDDDESVIGPYEKRNWDGGPMRAISLLIRDDHHRPIGVLCVNVAMAGIEQARATLELLARGVRVSPQPERLFRDDWQDKIITFLHAWLEARHLALGGLTREQKHELVLALESSGAFRGRNAVPYVAKVLDLGRGTVFKYLKAAREATAKGRRR
ncbi:MAG: PAS domain-containing protein [Gemmatimonadetes bacterium]|nr:PAS domain-containing protein [Gemmatimonadota bacterium]